MLVTTVALVNPEDELKRGVVLSATKKAEFGYFLERHPRFEIVIADRQPLIRIWH